MASPPRSGCKWLNLCAAGLRNRIEPHHSSSQRPAGSLLEHNSLDSAGLHTEGGGQHSKHSVHSQCYDGSELRGVEREVNLARGKQAVDIDLTLRPNIHFAVHHGRNVESKAESRAIARAVLLAVVEFMSDIGRVVGIKDCRRVGRSPAFR